MEPNPKIRPELAAGALKEMQLTQPFDMKKFSVEVSQKQTVSRQFSTFSDRFIDIDINHNDAYLHDFALFGRVNIKDSSDTDTGFAVDASIKELASIIQSITITADGEQLMYLDNARYLLSIMRQKKDSTEYLDNKRDVTAQTEAGVVTDWSAAVVAGSLLNNSQKSAVDMAAEKYASAAQLGKSTAASLAYTKENQRFCIFRLSELGLFEAFPIMLLKAGIKIRITLSQDIGIFTPIGLTGDAGAVVNAAANRVVLTDCVEQSTFWVPDSTHIKFLENQMMREPIRFAFNTLEGTQIQDLPQSGTHNISSSSSLLTKTYITFSARGTSYPFGFDANGDMQAALLSSNDAFYNSRSGIARTCPPLQHLGIQVAGGTFPGANTLDSTNAVELKSYTESIDGSVGVPTHRYQTDKFYTVVDYSSARKIFNVPKIMSDEGQETDNKFLSLNIRFQRDPVPGSKYTAYVYNQSRHMLLFHGAGMTLTQLK